MVTNYFSPVDFIYTFKESLLVLKLELFHNNLEKSS